MQAAQWGYLHATPEKYKDTRLAMYGGEAVGIEAEIEGAYLLDALFTVGPSEWQGGEERPISWAELAAYAKATGDVQEPWELRAIMAMSRAYIRGKREGVNVHCIAPVDREE